MMSVEDAWDVDAHDAACDCTPCLLDHFGKRLVRESEGGWGE